MNYMLAQQAQGACVATTNTNNNIFTSWVVPMHQSFYVEFHALLLFHPLTPANCELNRVLDVFVFSVNIWKMRKTIPDETAEPQSSWLHGGIWTERDLTQRFMTLDFRTLSSILIQVLP